MMKKLVLVAALAALSACSQEADEAPMPEDTMAATDTAMAPDAAATPMTAEEMAGTYDVKAADGTMTTTTINADGTYTDMAGGKETEKGTWEMTGGKTCFTPEGGEAMCFTDGTPAADGSWVATADDGTAVTVMRKPA